MFPPLLFDFKFKDQETQTFSLAPSIISIKPSMMLEIQ